MLVNQEFMYRNRYFVFVLFAKSSEKCNLIEACTNSASGDRNFVIVPIITIISLAYTFFYSEKPE